jgi:hypothetical protein
VSCAGESKSETEGRKVTTKTKSVVGIAFKVRDAGAIVEDAIMFCGRKTRLDDKDQVLRAIHSGDCRACDYVHYSVAKAMAEYLGSVDETVKAVYVYEPEHATHMDEPIPDRPGFSPAVKMIVWASRKSAALTSVVNMLGIAIAKELKQLVCSKSNALCYAVETHIVDDSEVLGRTGYGALIESLYVRPVEIWKR